MSVAPAIAVLPYGTRQDAGTKDLPTADLNWPLGCPDRLRNATASDMTPDDHLIIYPRTISHFSLRRGVAAHVSILQVEPSIIHAKHLKLLRLTHKRFFRVLTFNEKLLSRIPNGIFFPYGTTWVPEWRDLQVEKTEMTSLIASDKRDTTGHKLRHSIAGWAQETGQSVDILGRGYKPFKDKSDGLAQYRYSVVIENDREPNYFSEKLLDCILCSTVPIYWGCPNLERFFDPDGIIQCASEDDLKRAIENTTPEDFDNRLAGVKTLQTAVEPYCDLETRAAKAVLASI